VSEVYAAVEEPPGPGFRRKGNSSCPVGRAAPGVICGLIGSMRTASEAVLARQTLADLLKKLQAAVEAPAPPCNRPRETICNSSGICDK